MLSLLKNRRFYFLLAAIAAIGIGAYFFFFNKAPNNKENPYTVKKQDLKETLSLSGEIAAEENVTLRFATSGRLAWVGVKEGDYVKKYQVLASLDQREVQSNLKKYLNTYSSERNDFEQTKDDYKDRVVTDSIKRVLEKPQFDLNNSVIDVELKDLAIQYSNLWTPIEGIVVKADIPQAGVNVTPTQAEFQVVNPNSLYFLATADQSDVVKLAASQSAEITLDPFTDTTTKSYIKTISYTPKSGETGTVYELKMFLNPLSQYRLGMTGDVEFVIKEKSAAIAIPSKYIKGTNGSKYVLKKAPENKKDKHQVTIGENYDNLVEVKSGLSEGDVIYEQ